MPMTDDDYIEAARQAQADLAELEAAGIQPGDLEWAIIADVDERYGHLELSEGAAIKAELDALDSVDRDALAALTQAERIALKRGER
jgi:uncharacterized protein with PhoU and TrkA domain